MDSLLIEEIVEHYFFCALRSCTDDNYQPLHHNYDNDNISDETKELARSEITAWLECCHELGLICPFIEFYKDYPCPVEEQIGHNFWFTRNKDGVGFWSQGLGELGEKLSDAAETFGKCELYVGDDDLIYSR